MHRSNIRLFVVFSLTLLVVIGHRTHSYGQNIAGMQPLVDNERTLNSIAEKIKPFEEMAAACRTNSCPAIDCLTAQSIYNDLTNARLVIRHEYYWMSRGAEEMDEALRRLSLDQFRDKASYERARSLTDYRLTMARRARNKAHSILDRLTKLIVETGDGSLINCLAKLSSHCTVLNLNSGATVIIPQPARVQSFDAITDSDRGKNWARAMAVLQPLLSRQAIALLLKSPNINSPTRPTLKVIRPQVRAGEYVVVAFTASPCLSSGAWVSVVPSNVEHGSEQTNAANSRSDKELLRHRTNGRIRFAVPDLAGIYDLRLNDGEGKELATAQFRVSAGDTPVRPITPIPSQPTDPSEREVRDRKGKEIDWLKKGYLNEEFPNAFGEATFYCPANPSNNGLVAGDEIYAGNSSICMAAQHSGVITRSRGGTVTIRTRPDLGIYTGSTRNGVTSDATGVDYSSFYFVTRDAGRNRELATRIAERPARWHEEIPESWEGGVDRMPYKRMTYICPANGGPAGPVYGTNVYGGNSAVCVAAVHAGLITFASGGRVTFEVHPSLSNYHGSERNGVKSGDIGKWSSSFVFIKP